MNQQTLRLRAASLSVLSGIRRLPLYESYAAVLHSLAQDLPAFAHAYGALCDMIYRTGDAGSAFLKAIHCDTNALTGCMGAAPTYLLDAVSRDLATLNAICALDSAALLDFARESFPATMVFWTACRSSPPARRFPARWRFAP